MADVKGGDENETPNSSAATHSEWARDVLIRPSIPPLPAWIILGLVGLVIGLTINYAKTAVDLAALQDCENGQSLEPQDAGYISERWAWTTLFVVTIAALFAGWSPIFRREQKRVRIWAPRILGALVFALGWWWALSVLKTIPPAEANLLAQHVFGAFAGSLALIAANAVWRSMAFMGRRASWLTKSLQWIAGKFWKAPSWGLSAIDFALARPIAVLAGTKHNTLGGRYLRLGIWLSACLAVAIFAPAPWGLVGVVFGILIIFSVLRRWGWAEDDRAQHMFERGETPEDEYRIGFGQDLRDEAMTALVFIFLFIPLGLRQANAFELFATCETNGVVPGVLDWVWYFGAELAKAVPLVDWSEVYGVKNASPIIPQTGAGATAVFALRAALDLVLLTAVFQAVQLGMRLNEQDAAFFVTGKIDLLDPFKELAVFRALDNDLTSDQPLVTPDKQIPLAQWRLINGEQKRYASGRLRNIAVGAAPKGRAASAIFHDPGAQSAAFWMHAHQYPDDAVTIAQERLSGNAMDLRWALDACQFLLARSAPIQATQGLIALAARLSADARPDHVMTLAGALASSRDDETSDQKVGAVADAFRHDPHKHLAKLALTTGLPETPGYFAVVEKGKSFMMGSPEDEERWDGYDGREEPRHRVTFAHSFALARFALTFAEYDLFCDETGARRPPDQGWGRGRQPVINVSWDDICGEGGYLAWLNAKLGLTGRENAYRLPSEAEWEYACRAGTTTPFSFGETISTNQANYDGDYTYGSGAKGENRARTVAVHEFEPNALGLWQMHGNVWELCADRWHESYSGAPEDGSAWDTGESTDRVVRGGSWSGIPWSLRSAYRYGYDPDGRFIFQGFRLARTL